MKTPILKDARFWTALVDALATLVFIFLARFDPNEVDFYKTIWATIQPVVGLLIIAFTASEALAVKADYEKFKAVQDTEQSKFWAESEKK